TRPRPHGLKHGDVTGVDVCVQAVASRTFTKERADKTFFRRAEWLSFYVTDIDGSIHSGIIFRRTDGNTDGTSVRFNVLVSADAIYLEPAAVESHFQGGIFRDLNHRGIILGSIDLYTRF